MDDLRELRGGGGDPEELINKGIEAAREGNKFEARRLFEQALEADDRNVRAWLLLYRVTDDLDEKRLCLTTVLQIEPGNERAQQALKKLDAMKGREEVIPGVSRSQLRLLVGGAAALVILLLVAIVLISVSNSSRQAGEQQVLTDAANTSVALFDQQRRDIIEMTEEATAAAATLFAQASPTPLPTDTPLVPPTWTPTTEATATLEVTSLPYPDSVPGSIYAWSGRDLGGNRLLPIVVMPVAGRGQSTRVGSENGREVTVNQDGQQVIYTRLDALLTFDLTLELIRAGSAQPENLAQRWQPYEEFMLGAQMPYLSADGNQVVFVGKPPDSQTTQVYLMSLSVQGANPLIRLSNDEAAYTFPALSPDGGKVVVVREAVGAPGNRDLIVIDIASRSQQPLTRDSGTFLETTPRWSPDGRQIAYAAAPATEPQNHDIVILNSDGSGVPLLPVRNPADDLYPVYSPDGRYLAFASNRSGNYDIYVFDLTTGSLWQLTNSGDEDYPGGWIQ